MKEKLKAIKPSRPALFAFAWILLAPLVTLYASQVVWLQSVTAPVSWMGSHLPAVGLFWVLFSSLSLTIFGFTRWMFPAYLPEVSVFMGVAVTSRFKMNILGEPLRLSDFAYVDDLGEITAFAGTGLIPTVMTVVGVVITVVLMEIIRQKVKWRIPVTAGFILGSLCMVVFFSALYPGALQNAALAVDGGSADQEERCDRDGVVLGIYTAYAQRQTALLSRDGQAAAEQVARFRGDAVTPKEQLEAPDVVFITSETFFDVTELPLTFEEDPLPNYHALSEDYTDGHFVSNTYIAGTGNVEMEFLLGLSLSLLEEGDIFTDLSPKLYETIPSMVRCFANAGYSTTYVHSHTDNLFHRREIQPRLGFEEILFREDFLTPLEFEGDYVSDETFAKEIIARYEARDKSRPCFLYGLSMENHQKYYKEKFEEASGCGAYSDLLTEKELGTLDSLVYGLRDADACLGTLVDYFSTADRPVLLVFVGDHRAGLWMEDGKSAYLHLGMIPTDSSADWTAEELMTILSTNYLVWSNYEEEPRPDRTESNTLFGLSVLQRAGVPLDAWFTWLAEEVAPHMEMTRRNLFIDAEGNPSYEVPDFFAETLETYARVEYSLLYGKP